MDELLKQIGAMLDAKLAPVTERLDKLEAQPTQAPASAPSAPPVLTNEPVVNGHVTRIVRPGHIFMGKRGGQPVQVLVADASASATIAGTMTPDEFEDAERAKRIPKPSTGASNVELARQLLDRTVAESQAEVARQKFASQYAADVARAEAAKIATG